MIADSLARRYAVAIFKLSVESGELDQINQEICAINEIIMSKENFRYFLYSPKINREVKKQVLTDVFKEHVSKSMLHFLFLLLDKKRQTLFEKIFSHFSTLYDNHHSRAAITVMPAVDLGENVLNEIKEKFEKILNKTITVEQKVDSSLLGGLQVRVKNTVYDASILSKLRRIQKQLT